MKILIFGRGVIATQYAWALEQAGNNITFYVRTERIAEYDNKIQLDILDARKKLKGKVVKQTWAVKMIDDLPKNHDYELIIVSVQHYHFKEVADFLSTRIDKATVLFFNNFWEEPLEATSMLPQAQLVWGFPKAGGGFDKNNVLNGTLMKSTTFGSIGKPQTERDNTVIALFQSAGFKPTYVQDFRSWLYIHFVFNASIQLEMLQGETKKLDSGKMKSSQFWKNVILNSKELIPLLKARKVDLKASSELKLLSLPAWLISFFVKMAMALLPPARKIIDSHNNINELKSYCQDVLSKAEELNIELPRYKKYSAFFEIQKKQL